MRAYALALLESDARIPLIDKNSPTKDAASGDRGARAERKIVAMWFS
jgi:hypothetical protein